MPDWSMKISGEDCTEVLRRLRTAWFWRGNGPAANAGWVSPGVFVCTGQTVPSLAANAVEPLPVDFD